LPYFAANVTFALAKANVPSCQNSTANGWFSGINNDENCGVATKEPVFSYARTCFPMPDIN